MAMQGEEKVSPIMACTWAGLMHGALGGVNATSLPLTKASATLTPLAMEAQASYILYPREMPGSKSVLLLISSMAKSITWAYWKPLKFKLHVESKKKLKVKALEEVFNRNHINCKDTTLSFIQKQK